jgi:hypothetical protein
MQLRPTGNLRDSWDTYWSVDDQPTFSKIQALYWAGGDPARVRFHWMENTWDSVDFSKEPQESWQELCCQRARQIREKYDTVCLWYSGGWDSACVLKSFIDADCLIDEIGVLDWSYFYDDGEISSAYDTIEWYRNHKNSKLRLRQAKIDFDHTSSWWQTNHNWIFTPGDTVRFARPHVGLRVDSVKEINGHRFEQSRADVMGFEKPKLDIYQGQWRTFMPDTTMANAVCSGVEQFYCSDEMPQLHVKQVHMAMHFFERYKILDHKDVHSVQSHNPVNNMNWYPRWNESLGRVQPKNLASVLGTQKHSNPPTLVAPMDQKLTHHAKSTNDRGWQIYLQGINEIKSILPWWDPLSTNFSNATLCSKFYQTRPVNYGS